MDSSPNEVRGVAGFAALAISLGLSLTACPEGAKAPVGHDASPDTTVTEEDGTGTTDSAADTGAGDLPSPSALLLGPASHTIVVEVTASASELTGAAELQSYLGQALGGDWVVSTGAPADGTPMIVVGMGPTAEGLGVAPEAADLGEQGYVLKTAPPHVVIAGTAAAGTMYGAYRFLHEHVGVRWYAPGVTHAPSLSEVPVPELDELVTPAFQWRHTSYRWPGKDDAFLAQQGDNNGDAGADSEHGVEHAHDGRAHSYFRFIHPDDYFDVHPEYFSEIGGTRVREETQLCLTNPEVLDIVTEKMLQRMADKPHVRQHNFSQQDHYNYCTCDACAAMNAQYGTHGGTQFWFASELASRTIQQYPDKLIGTLAYMYTEEPPVGLELHPNVAVWLCHMYPSCDSHPIATCPRDADYKRRAEAWSAQTQHLYIWHYIVDFTHYYNPFPNLRAMAADMRFYRDIGVEGIYLQGMGHSGGGGEFSLLRPWYGMQLLWDPDQDPDALRSDFLNGYYGAAGEHLRAYVELLHDKVEQDDIHMHLYTNPAQGYLPDEVMTQADAHFDAAEAAVTDDSELLERVRVARMPLTYARFFPRNGYTLSGDKLQWNGASATLDELYAFLDRMDEHGFTTVREVSGETSTMLLAYAVVGQDQQVKQIANDHLQVDVVPSMGGRALRILHLASGESVTAIDVRKGLFYPFNGGMEDRVGGIFRFFGWVEPATVEQQDAASITTAQDTFDGLELVRTLTLDPAEPILHVQTTVTNPSDSSQEVRLRNHLELDLGELPQTRVTFTSLDGASVDKDITDIIANLREGEHYYDQAAPAGEWRFRGTKGLEVIQRFDSGDIDFTWLYSYPAELSELEVEIWAHRTTLGPSESVTLTHSIEVRPTP